MPREFSPEGYFALQVTVAAMEFQIAQLSDMVRKLEDSRERDEAVIRCQKCDAILGVSSGSVLAVGGSEFTLTTTIRCSRCDTVRTWRPGA